MLQSFLQNQISLTPLVYVESWGQFTIHTQHQIPGTFYFDIRGVQKASYRFYIYPTPLNFMWTSPAQELRQKYELVFLVL